MTQETQNNIQQIAVSIQPFLKDAGISRCFVFGSYASGQETPESDIDLLVDFYAGKEPDLFAFIALKDKLEGKLGKKVDMTTSDALSPYIRTDILQTAQILYEGK